MLNINIICAGSGKVREEYLRNAVAEYEKRISAYARVKFIEADEDDASILAAIPQRSYVFALCIGGEQLSSEAFASCLERVTLSGFSTVSFIIGGSNGFGKIIEEKADFRLSFSKMTFPHRLMRVILLEQIYRALSINHGGKYHK
ncbi:MAG: 23S rRNA (pseudouridine(1915)-N(3))-methyltransferase RlmH [Clostridia bacterium]|nr:23S rRNA (pseudouridine(1915)-N(3))-methyltransferase RlmH [Clostridia bacterium]